VRYMLISQFFNRNRFKVLDIVVNAEDFIDLIVELLLRASQIFEILKRKIWLDLFCCL
jgi:hypothetical protein